jgi:hypothetical protein
MHQSSPNTSETVQLFFNGNTDNKEKNENIYKDYIITQNNNLLTENKKLTKDMLEWKKKYDELDDENDTMEKRLRNTKHYLKNFRFINEALEYTTKKFCDFTNDIKINYFINELKILIASFSFIMVVLYFLLTNWITFITFVTLHVTFGYILYEWTILPQLKAIKIKQKDIMRIKREKENEIKDMKKTMDIISTFVDDL